VSFKASATVLHPALNEFSKTAIGTFALFGRSKKNVMAMKPNLGVTI